MTDKPTTTPTITKKRTAPTKPVAATKPAAKTSKPAAAAPIVAATKPEAKKEKKQKQKVIRDSFTLPQDDYAKIAELKQVCLKAGLHVKKSELIRAGLRLLSKLDATQLHAELDALEKIKTGRPKAS